METRKKCYAINYFDTIIENYKICKAILQSIIS